MSVLLTLNAAYGTFSALVISHKSAWLACCTIAQRHAKVVKHVQEVEQSTLDTDNNFIINMDKKFMLFLHSAIFHHSFWRGKRCQWITLKGLVHPLPPNIMNHEGPQVTMSSSVSTSHRSEKQTDETTKKYLGAYQKWKTGEEARHKVTHIPCQDNAFSTTCIASE